MAVASLQILKSSLLSPVSISRSNFPGKSDSRKVFIRSRSYKRSRCYVRRKLKVCCGIQEGDNQSNGKLFNVLCFSFIYLLILQSFYIFFWLILIFGFFFSSFYICVIYMEGKFAGRDGSYYLYGRSVE